MTMLNDPKQMSIKKLLIDFDILMYEAAHKADGKYYHYPEVDFDTPFEDEMSRFIKLNKLDKDLVEICYSPQSPQVAYDCIDHRMKEILADFGDAVEYSGFLTGRGNFRYRVATIQRYKGNRVELRKPQYIQEARQYLIDTYKAVEVKEEEADDAMGYSQREDTCICTTDKDLKQIPGWHYQWSTPWHKESFSFFVEPIEGLRYFYKQLIIGDRGDNILGLYGISKDSVYCKRIDALETEQDMFDLVYALYKQRFGNYTEQFLLETGRLLWIRREERQMWDFKHLIEGY